MGKTRVYELAQKLSVDNKVLVQQLQDAGIDVKSHMSVLEEEDLRKFQESSSAVEEQVEEKRVQPGVIRRRRTMVVSDSHEEDEAAAAPPKAVRPETPAPQAAKPAATKPEPAEPAATPSAAEVAPEVKSQEPAALEAEAVAAKAEPTSPATPEAAKPSASEEQPAAPKKAEPKAPRPVVFEPSPAKATASRAKILGRVELPTPGRSQQDAQDRGQGRPPRPGQPERPARPDQSGRPPRPGQGDRPARPDQAGRPPRPGQGDRPARPGQGDRPARPEGGFGAGRFPSAPAETLEVFPGKEVRSTKKKKGRSVDLKEESESAKAAKRGRRVEFFDGDRMPKGRKPRKGQRSKETRQTEITQSKAIKRIIRISDSITVGELAKRMGIKANELIAELMRQGSMVTINHPLDFETASLLATEFSYEVENVAFDEAIVLEHAGLEKGEQESQENLQPRPPVVTIMGHVDHGKTSLLDAIRHANITAGEAGGITQHIGAYDVEINGNKISFLDTPGHEAFTAMRSRGAKVTDIVILVVAADDGVMPQTREAINHSKAAGVPIIVAINKIDKPDANPDRVKQELTEFSLVPEDWGGDTIFVEVSAKQKINLEQLLEMILLQAEVLELKANPGKRAKGSIIEARLDRGRGPVATVLVQEGTLRVGDAIVAGVHYGRVRSMVNDRGIQLQEAGPSCPVEVTGLTGTPEAGDSLHCLPDEKAAREVAQHRQQKLRELELAKISKISLDELFSKMKQGEVQELKVIVKADVQGSVEAVKESLTKLSTDACRLVVIHSAVGGISESDVTLASASDSIVLGFNVRPEPKAAALAEKEGVDLRLYSIIYDAVNDIRDAMEGLLAPTLREKHLGRVEVRDTFVVSKVGTIAGCYVLDGKVVRNAQVRLVRDNVVVWEGKLSSLKRFKDDAREVATGYECGIGLQNYNDIKVGDIIEAFEMEETKTEL